MRNRKEYSEDWTDRIRPDILKRDEYKCQHCGVKHRQYVLVDSSNNYTLISKDEHDEYKPFGAKTYRIFLQIAHKDNTPSNNDYGNLIALCPRCHIKMDKAHSNLLRISDKKKVLQ
jgi:5-methylcytosine-specific restriction endonuclease McrA